MGISRRIVEVVSSKGCTTLVTEATASFRSNNTNNVQQRPRNSDRESQPGPFSGLVICVTGLSKETRKQAKAATEELGGVYSPNLHPKCTHLVIQSIGELKSDSDALKYASSKNGLILVTIGWFVDSVRRQVRLSEDLYSVKQPPSNICNQSNGIRRFTGLRRSESPCFSVTSNRNSGRNNNSKSALARKCLHIDLDISPEMQKKVTRKNLECGSEKYHNCQERQGSTQKLAKKRIRSGRGSHMQTFSTPVLQATPSNLLDSICWNISDPTSTASTYIDSLSSDVSENEESIFADAKSEVSTVSSFSRPLNESEKSEQILSNQFLTILFPIDAYDEMGPSSRSFFSKKGFTCLQVLDHIYTFYQENMTAAEIEIAIQTNSRRADLLRLISSSKEATKRDPVAYSRLNFLGNRKSFEMLKRVPGESYKAVYELLIRA